MRRAFECDRTGQIEHCSADVPAEDCSPEGKQYQPGLCKCNSAICNEEIYLPDDTTYDIYIDV